MAFCLVQPVVIMLTRVWFSTLFAQSLPYPTALRILDITMCQGPTFLTKISVALLKVSSKRVVAMNSCEDILRYLTWLPADELVSPDGLVKVAGKIDEEGGLSRIQTRASGVAH